MGAVELREKNWWQILDVLKRTKGAIVQVTGEDHLLHQVDVSIFVQWHGNYLLIQNCLKECAAKLETNIKKAKERQEDIDAICKSADALREKFDALRTIK